MIKMRQFNNYQKTESRNSTLYIRSNLSSLIIIKINPYMVPVAFYSKQTILTQTHSLFAKHGIQTLTIDDISKQTNIPINAIHKHFTNKDELVEQSLHHLFTEVKRENEFIKKFYVNPLDKLVYSAYNLMCQLFKFGSDFFYDLKRYFPDIFREYRQEGIPMSFCRRRKGSFELKPSCHEERKTCRESRIVQAALTVRNNISFL